MLNCCSGGTPYDHIFSIPLQIFSFRSEIWTAVLNSEDVFLDQDISFKGELGYPRSVWAWKIQGSWWSESPLTLGGNVQKSAGNGVSSPIISGRFYSSIGLGRLEGSGVIGGKRSDHGRKEGIMHLLIIKQRTGWHFCTLLKKVDVFYVHIPVVPRGMLACL